MSWTCTTWCLSGHSVSAMIGVLASIEEPTHFAKLILLTPSPCYLDDGDYRGGFSRADIDELLESLDSNYLGWSATMAPVIMGNDHGIRGRLHLVGVTGNHMVAPYPTWPD